jgi:thioredoxin 1
MGSRWTRDGLAGSANISIGAWGIALRPTFNGTERMTTTTRTFGGPEKASRGDNIRTASGTTFKSLVLEGVGPIAVEFMSYGCAHCRAIEPILQQVAEMLKSKETIFRVNVGVEQELARDYEIQGTPTLIMFLNGSEVGRVEGLSPTTSSALAAVTQAFDT